MAIKPKFNPKITRVKLNPEQAVLWCNCYDTGQRVHQFSFAGHCVYRVSGPGASLCGSNFSGSKTHYEIICLRGNVVKPSYGYELRSIAT